MTGRSTVALPKAHLHLHLEGSARPRTIAELAQRKGVSLDGFWDFKDVDEFYAGYLMVSDLVTRPEDLARICYELIEDEAAQGVTYSQPGISPQVYSPRFGSVEDVFDVMSEAFDRASEATGVAVGCMIEVDLWRSAELAELMARFAAECAGRGVDAFGIATFDPNPEFHRFVRTSEIAREAGLLFVPHAGEHDGPENVRDALDFLKADRIAHGIRSAEDRNLLARLAAEGIPCDVCPTSNVRLNAVPELIALPLPTMLHAGVRVTINSDDQLFFGSGVAEEYALIRETFGLADDELASIARTSADASGAPQDVIAQMRLGIDQWLSADP